MNKKGKNNQNESGRGQEIPILSYSASKNTESYISRSANNTKLLSNNHHPHPSPVCNAGDPQGYFHAFDKAPSEPQKTFVLLFYQDHFNHHTSLGGKSIYS